MDCQVDKKSHFRHLLLFAFNRGQKAAQAARDICAVYGEAAIGESTAREWFAKFKKGIFDLEDASRSGRPVEFDEDHLESLLKEDDRQTTRELAEKMDSNAMTVSRHLAAMEKVQRLALDKSPIENIMHFDGDQKIEDVKSEKDDSFDIPSSSLPKSNAQEKEALSKVRHYYIPVQEKGQWKFDTFCDLHNVVSMSKTIIFVNNTKHSWIDALGKQLKEKGFSAYVAKGRALNQCKKYQQFVKNSRNTISNDCLVTTDQMYKGGSKLGCFPLVVNYDMPSSKQKYYKRVCCSSGQTGVAITFLEEHEMKKLKEVEETYGIKIEKMPVHSQK